MARAKLERKRSTRRGVSLVEVLVVMVVLIIGMLAIARLFPEGFATLDYTGNVTLADALAKQNADDFEKHRENLPDGIVGVDYNTGLMRNIEPADYIHNEPYEDNPITGGPVDDPRRSGANKVRRIIGEQFKLQPPSAVSYTLANERVSLYRALFSPIYSILPMVDSPPTRTPSVASIHAAGLGVSAYSGTPSQRVAMSDPPTSEEVRVLLQLGPLGYGVNYDKALLYFVSMPYSRAYKVEFTSRAAAGGAARMAPDNTLALPADSGYVPNPDATGNVVNPIRLQAFDMRGNRVYDAQHDTVTGVTAFGAGAAQAGAFSPLGSTDSLDPGSDLLYRKLTVINANQAFSQDPYEYKVYDTVYGLFGFHPALAMLPLPKQAGRGLTIRIDYDVDDWHILHQDQAVPTTVADTAGSQPFYTIKLSTGAIKRVGDTEDFINFIEGGNADQNTFEYQGLVRYYPGHGPQPARPGTPGIDVVIVDVETGLRVDSRTLQKPGAAAIPGVNNNDGEIDYETGVIHLRPAVQFQNPFTGAPAQTLDPAGRMLRIYYRSAKDFAVATYKPYVNYFRSIDTYDFFPPAGVLPAADRRFFQFVGDTINGSFPPGSAPGSSYLLVANAEGERNLAVDYQWQDTATGAIHTEVEELHQVRSMDDTGAPAMQVMAAPFNQSRWWWIRVNHADRDPGKGSNDDGADTYIDGSGSKQLAVAPGSIRVVGLRGTSLETHVVWRQNRRWRHHTRSTVLTREFTR